MKEREPDSRSPSAVAGLSRDIWLALPGHLAMPEPTHGARQFSSAVPRADGPGLRPKAGEVRGCGFRNSSVKTFGIAHRHVAARSTPTLEPAAQSVLHKRTSVGAFRERKQVELTT